MMISKRYAPIVAVLLALTFFPVFVHTYAGLKEEDGRTSRGISPILTGLQSEATSRSPQSMKKNFDSLDWIERRYLQKSGQALRLFVARSYDHKRLFHHPEIALVRGVDLEDLGITRIPGASEISFRLLRASNASSRDLVVYSLLHDQRFVEDPFRFLVQTAWSALFQRRKAMTLFFVYDPEAPETSLAEAPAVRLLMEAIRDFRAQSVLSENPGQP